MCENSSTKTQSAARRLPDLIYRLERLVSAANEVATRHQLRRIGAPDVSVRAQISSAAAPRGAKGKRLRSRNAYVDQFLAEEEGDDNYADLEDWIVTGDQDEQ
jgi:hypothetical protein